MGWPASDSRAAEAAFLEQYGLYDPSFEHDACGVGLVAAIDGKPRREIVEKAILALKAVWHRGAVDADGKTGDGAGIHLALPEDFFAEKLAQMGQSLRHGEKLAVGMLFLPRKNLGHQEQCRAIIETEVLRMGYRLLGWRRVPVNIEVIGDTANESRPEIEQVFIAVEEQDDNSESNDINETQASVMPHQTHNDTPACSTSRNCLYLIRRRVEHALRRDGIQSAYICSLSTKSIIYKGLFKAEQLSEFYPDLLDERFTSHYAIYHQRFSTNTAPAWALAQPFRMLAHNGEINTIRGNMRFMQSHEATMHAPAFAGFEDDLRPVIPEGLSDTGALDAAFELLCRAGHPAPLTKQILIPPAWAFAADIPAHHKAMFHCLNSICEPWDGPAAMVATDGRWVIAGMDRGGLRPMRYAITTDGLLLIGSESGMVPVEESRLIERGRLGPGECIGIDSEAGRFYHDRELKDMLSAEHPYPEWAEHITQITAQEFEAGFDSLPPHHNAEHGETAEGGATINHLISHQLAIGLTFEDIEMVLSPMARDGKEPIGSMGDDTPPAVLSDQMRGFHHYFRQLFSQVTNPPLDSLRERRVMSLYTRFGNGGNFLSLNNSYGRALVLESPILLSHELEVVKSRFPGRVTVITTVFNAEDNRPGALRRALSRITKEAETAVRGGITYLLLTDQYKDARNAGIPMMLAASAINAHLVRCRLRKSASLLVQSAECFDVHHAAMLISVGATVVHPWLAEATIRERHAEGLLPRLSAKDALYHFKGALEQGLLKIMAKMGISVVSSYRNGYNMEAIGLSRALVSEFFPGVPSRLSGIGLEGLEARLIAQHIHGFGRTINEREHGPHAASLMRDTPGFIAQGSKREQAQMAPKILPIGGFYRYRARAETHALAGPMVHMLQSAVGSGDYALYKRYTQEVYAQPPLNLRSLLGTHSDRAPIALHEVEPASAIVKRFIAPAMSLGALSPEAHEVLAIACNEMGASSNSGEGGEGPERYGTRSNSAIKQVASARFGVTAEYLNSARELQIKVAQGAKPGEGGQLPGFKVTTEIARLRHATPGVGLISPPPHHDIYSIEDLAQLIYDLKQINPEALVSVKLVSQAGVGTIACGVAKAMADKIIIAGHSGGTGASPLSSIKFAGSPWEMGLAETTQLLSLNRLRHRVRLQTDGGLKTGRDILMAALLGAEEYAIGTASLVAMGCLMVRQCHANTCPVGICTQDERLRAKFTGTVDKVIHLFTFIAEELREEMAALGYAKLDDMIGRTDLVRQVSRGPEDLVDLDLTPLLARPDAGFAPRICTIEGRNAVLPSLDETFIRDLERGNSNQPQIIRAHVANTERSIGARLSSWVLRQKLGDIAEDHLRVQLRGTAGQSLGAFLARGITIELEGDANDYVGKGLSGGVIIAYPPRESHLIAADNTILGNTVLYGATSGALFAAGRAGERFAVRNSGALAVVEGAGSNALEYMTGGVAVILGPVGDNIAAGMTGGMAFIYDEAQLVPSRLNDESVIACALGSAYWEDILHGLITRHAALTGSQRAKSILANWKTHRLLFQQICPKDMLSRLDYPLKDAA